ncbi:MAG: CIA30 family protein [Pseudomonadota bacterium]
MAGSDEVLFEDFDATATSRWTYVQDGVMGGVSQGQARVENGTLILSGTVSTANNGGFIQVRQRGFPAWPSGAKGLRLSVQGNGEDYYVFLRTPELARVFYSYRATFQTGADWADVEIPFSSFAASSDRIPQSFDPENVTSIGVVAYGRDHVAELRIRSISLY